MPKSDDNVELIINKVKKAQNEYETYSQSEVDKIFKAAAIAANKARIPLAELAFNEKKIAVFEAGTGVGKSYSYLIPSILWSLQNNQKVVISTGTINLQQQLCEKDIPAVEKILGKEVKHVLLKGRQNYICKRRMNDVAGLLDLFEDESNEIKKISQWAMKSETGSKSELTFMPSENAWSKVNSESDGCMGMRCPYHSECFVMKVRK